MLSNPRVYFGAVALVAASAMPALAASTSGPSITSSASVGCQWYSLSLNASNLAAGQPYAIGYTINVTPGSSGFPITGSIAIPSSADTGGTFSDEVNLFFPPLSGSYAFSGATTLASTVSPVTTSTSTIAFNPTALSCAAPPPPPACNALSASSSNFNGTPISGGDYVWFNANFSASGIPSSGATITLTNSTITFIASGATYNLTIPNAVITFSPNATCTSTSFVHNMWTTTVPIRGDDEIFLTGLSWPVPAAGLPGGVNPVAWTGTFGAQTLAGGNLSGVSVQWKWGAAAYSPNFTQDYTLLGPKPGHQTACGASNGDHAGTPEGANSYGQPLKKVVLGGARGGGGSNWTGSWSGTMNAAPVCGH